MESRRRKQDAKDDEPFCNMVLLMGVTGSGKSFFINKLKENATVIGNDLYSSTATCQIVMTRIGRSKVAVVDCPGFNDTFRSDTEILKEIAEVLSTQYLLESKFRLRGILWLRDITKTRMDGSDVKILNLFIRLVGKKAFRHTVFVTTMWNRLDSQLDPFAFERETQLKDEFWREMMDGGSYSQRFLGTKASAEGILSQLVGAEEPVVLRIQKELVDDELPLSATAAGSVLVPDIDRNIEERESMLKRSRNRLAKAWNNTTQESFQLDVKNDEKERDLAHADKDKLDEKVGAKMKDQVENDEKPNHWQEGVRTICTALGLSIQIVGFILPVALGASCTVM